MKSILFSHMNFIKIIYTIIFFFILYPTVAQDFYFLGKVITESDDAKGTVVTIYKNGSPYKKVMLQSIGKFSIRLHIQNEYLLIFENENYITKIIYINAYLPDPQNLEIEPFWITIRLIKGKDNNDSIIMKLPDIRIRFYPEKDSFDYEVSEPELQEKK